MSEDSPQLGHDGAVPDSIPWTADRSEMGDADLISAVRGDGDQDAYGVLYERHCGAARSLARRLLYSEPEVEDVVHDTFAKIFDVMARGGGPEESFRPYLLTAIRRTVYDRAAKERRQIATDQIERFDDGQPFIDPAVEGLERSMVAKAFLSLPERWQLVLWHTEIEGDKPAKIAPLLGINANGVAALAYRAREGLRQAYLQMHLQIAPADACRPVVEKLGAYVRGGLRKRESSTVDGHLKDCNECNTVYLELSDLNHSLKIFIGPLFAGPVLAGYLAGGATSGGAGATGLLTWWRSLPKSQQAGATGTVAAVAAAAVALLLVADHEPLRPPAPPPKAAEPPEAKPKPPKARKPQEPPQPPPPPPPAASPSPRPARVTAAVDPIGSLVRDRDGLVGVRLRNEGKGRSKDLVAELWLPPGVDVVSGGKGGASGAAGIPVGDGWACRSAKIGVQCSRGALAVGASTALYVPVAVAADAPIGRAPAVRISGSGKRVVAHGTQGVQEAGATGRFAAEGPVTTTAIGNSLMSCDERVKGCAHARKRKGKRLDNDLWKMKPLDLDNDKSTKSSSAAALGAVKGGKVLWAGLYWSGSGGKGDHRQIKLREPGSDKYRRVRATEADRVRLPSGRAYQSFADVTKLVRRAAKGGTGRWWVADAAMSPGISRYAGWSLVVVRKERGAPDRQAAVLDTAVALDRRRPQINVPLGGLLPAAEPATIGMVAWEGDADLTGDQALIDGEVAVDAFDSTAEGAIGNPLTLGVDVKAVRRRLGTDPAVKIKTRRDALLFGVVAVSVRSRS